MHRVLIAFLVITASAAASAAPNFLVTTGADSGLGSLRQAILELNQATACSERDPCRITFPPLERFDSLPLRIDLRSPLPSVRGQNLRIGPGEPGSPYFWRLVAEIHGQGDGIDIEGSINVTISGISLIGFPGNGIVVNRSSEVTLDSVSLLGNGKNGLLVADSKNIRVGAAINSNRANGIYATRSAGIVVSGSFIGTDVNRAVLSNGANGIHLDNVQAASLLFTAISNNGNNGLLVTGDSSYNNFEYATFEHNGLLGIDIGNDGPTPANAPVLSSAEINHGTIRVKGSVHSSPDTKVSILIYLSNDADPSGFGEGARVGYRVGGPLEVTTDAGGDAVFTRYLLDFGDPVPHKFVSAIGTRLAGSSEFSQTLPVISAEQEFVVTTTADSGAGSLRDAIERVNHSPDCNFNYQCDIVFHIAAPPSPGTGAYTISPRTPLPALTRGRLSILGATQREFSGDTNPSGPEVEINGSACAACNVLEVRITDQSTTIVDELTIDGFTGDGIAAIGDDPPHEMRIDIKNCYIGSDPTGTRAVPNGRGMHLENTQAFIGLPLGASSGFRPVTNVISGNAGDGVHMANSHVSIDGNLIGTDRTGYAPLGNGGNGIVSECSALVRNNSIAFNRGSGVVVLKPAIVNQLVQNRIYANAALGIDIGGDGETENGTPGIVDAPEIVSARADGNETRVTFRAPAPPRNEREISTDVALYASSFADSSGRGEGRMLIGDSVITLDRIHDQYEVVIPGNFAGKYISGVTTLFTGFEYFEFIAAATTSEFGNALQVTSGDCPALTPLIISATSANGDTTFKWSALPGATEYRIWTMSPGDEPRIAYRGTDSEATRRIAAGTEWWVEARFDPCYGTQSEHRFVER